MTVIRHLECYIFRVITLLNVINSFSDSAYDTEGRIIKKRSKRRDYCVLRRSRVYLESEGRRKNDWRRSQIIENGEEIRRTIADKRKFNDVP